jgi:hypothetical protein
MRAGGARSQALPSPGCASVPARRRAGGARSQALPSPGCASVPARRRAGGARSQALPSPGCAGVSRPQARRRRALPGTAIPWVRQRSRPQARRRRALPGTAIPWVRGSQSPVCAPEARAPRHCHPLGARESVACVRAGGARSQALPSPGCAGVSRLYARRRRALPGTAIPWVRQRPRPQARRRRAFSGTAIPWVRQRPRPQARRRRALPGTAIPWVRGGQLPVCAPEARAPRHCHLTGAGFWGSPCMPSSVSGIRTPKRSLLPLWEKGAGG